MNENRNIEALRGLAALAVFFSHSDASHLATTQWLTANKFSLGKFGVYLFFGISGYLIWRSASRCLSQPDGWVIYALHRVTRILPLYLVNLLFVIFALGAIGSNFVPTISIESILRHLTFTQSLTPSVQRELNPVLWTLTHEFLFYIVTPVLCLLSRKIPSLLIVAALVALSGVSMNQDLGVFGPFFQVLYAFAVGIALAELKSTWLPCAAVTLMGLAVIARIYSCGPEIVVGLGALSVLAFALCSFSTAATARPGLGKWVAPVAFVGTVSYSLYIWHYLLIGIAEYHMKFLNDNLLGWSDRGLARGIFFSAFVFFVSWVSYSLIERPAMGRMRQAIQSRMLGQRGKTSV